MQKYLENEHVFKTILRHIMKTCERIGIAATETCIASVIRLVILEPGTGFLTMTREECQYSVDELVELCMKKLSRELSPSLLTIKMQSYFTNTFLSRDKMVAEHRLAIAKLTEPLMRELMEKEVKEKDFIDTLYHKLAVAITLLSGLGNPTNRGVLCSATVALSSTFPVNEMPRFLALGKLDKERQIEELTNVVAGIRIFNYDTHKHVEGIDDLPSILKEACIASKESIENEKMSACQSIDLLSQLLNECYVEHLSENDADEVDIMFTTPLKMNPDMVEFFRDLLTAKRQMDLYLGQLLDRVERCEDEVDGNIEMLRARLTDLQETVRYRTAIPTAYVYPKFMQVAAIWYSLQDQMVLLSSYNSILQNLKSFFNEFDQKTTSLELLVQTINARKIRKELMKSEHTDETQEKNEGIFIDESKIQNCRVVFSEINSDNLDEKPQFLGCCTLRLILGNGVLLPGDPKIGMLNFGMLNYSFATCESAYTFDKKPEVYLKQIFNLVRKMPELISLLGMNDAINRFIYMKELKKQTDEEIVKIDSETQTELHPVDSCIDTEYSWDLWELKRRAVQLANISKMKTHSTQTFKSNMRMTVGTQTYPLKEVSTQTRRDNRTTMPTLSTFMFGLRGRKDNVAHTAILTRPIDEWLCDPGARILFKEPSETLPP